MSLQDLTQRLALMLVLSICVRAQAPYDPYNSASVPAPSIDPFAEPPDSGFGERPHTVFERLDRSLMNASFPSDNQPEAPGTVSVQELRQTVSREGKSLIKRAQRYAKAGKHGKAIEVLQRALLDSTSIAYAQGMLGAEYLKSGDIPAALTHLKEAVNLLPTVAANHSNLGYALCSIGDMKAGEQEIREALRIDGSSPQSHFLLGLILLDRATTEASRELLFAQQHVSSALLALSVYHAHRGETSEAEQDLHAYLQANPSIDPRSAAQWVASAGALQRPALAFGFPSARNR